MASATAEALDRARKSNANIREAKDEAERAARKWRSGAKEAAEELDKASGKLKRLSEAVTDRESPERAVAVVLASGTVSLLAGSGVNYLTDKIGSAVPFVGRNADWFKGGVPTALGLVGWVGELATRPKGPLSTGREIMSSSSAASLLLGLDRLGRSWWQRSRENARILARARTE